MDAISVMYGMCVGSILTILIVIGGIIADHISEEKRHRKLVRRAHDQGYADGRRWRGLEKMWVENQFEEIWKEIREIEDGWKISNKSRTIRR